MDAHELISREQAADLWRPYLEHLAAALSLGGADHCPGNKVNRMSDDGVELMGEVFTFRYKGQRIVGSTREALAQQLKARYERGETLRALAEDTGRSYGFVHRVLSETGVEMRSRGGKNRVGSTAGGRSQTRATTGSGHGWRRV